MKERVLITGASGFVGYHLIEGALEAGLDVYAAVRPSSETAHLRDFSIQYTSLDFNDADALRQELEKKQYHYIIHAAGITKAKHAQEYEKVNAEYTRNLGVAAAAAGIPLKKFVFISSLAALGPTSYAAGTPIHEASEARPVTAYGKSKLLAEKYLAQVERLPLVVLRPTAVYGPREKDIFIILKTLNLGLEPYISKKPQWLSFVYVKDLAKAVIQALGASVNGESYNVSDGNCYDRYALASISKGILGRKSVRFHVPMGIMSGMTRLLEALYATSSKMPALNLEKLNELAAENWNCSIDKIQEELGFVPEYDLKKGLAHTLQWYKENKWL